jgi:hypothetical protein
VELLTIPDAAEALDTDVLTVHRLLKEGDLVELRVDGVRRIPGDFIQDAAPVKSIKAVIQLLRDAKFTDTEIVDWLYREDDTLPGTPIRALRENRGTEVKRRAQAAGF